MMPFSENEIIYLLQVYSNGEATYAEEQMLFKWVNNNDNERLFYKHIESILAGYELTETEPSIDWELIYRNIKNEIK